MIGRITYVVTLASTPAMSPFLAANIFALVNVFADVIPIGDTQDIVLHRGYAKLDPVYDDKRNISQSASGVVEIRHFLSTLSFQFTIKNIYQNRSATEVNEYAVMQSLSEECARGTALTWYPEWDSYPSEYYSCVANKRPSLQRVKTLMWWDFTYDLLVLPSVQIPSTVPPFVAA